MALVSCPNCSSQISDRAEICTHCKQPPRSKQATCPECNAGIDPALTVCPNCGAPVESAADSHASGTAHDIRAPRPAADTRAEMQEDPFQDYMLPPHHNLITAYLNMWSNINNYENKTSKRDFWLATGGALIVYIIYGIISYVALILNHHGANLLSVATKTDTPIFVTVLSALITLQSIPMASMLARRFIETAHMPLLTGDKIRHQAQIMGFLYLGAEIIGQVCNQSTSNASLVISFSLFIFQSVLYLTIGLKRAVPHDATNAIKYV